MIKQKIRINQTRQKAITKSKNRTMAIKGKKIKKANRILLNSDNRATGVIKSVEFLEGEEKAVGKSMQNFSDQFEFLLEVEGDSNPITMRIWTGTKLNPEKSNDGDFNKLTNIVLNAGLMTLDDIKSHGGDFDGEILNELEGKKVSFQVEPSRKNKGLSIPKISTLKVVES